MAALMEEQDKRRGALIERLGTVADLACETPFPGELGDVAYDLLREAAAQIASDRQRITRLAHSEPRPVAGEPVAWSYRLATAVSGDGTYSRWDKGPRLSWEKPTVPEGSIRDLTPLYAATHSPAPTEAGEETFANWAFWLKDAEQILRLNGTTSHADKLAEVRGYIAKLSSTQEGAEG